MKKIIFFSLIIVFFALNCKSVSADDPPSGCVNYPGESMCPTNYPYRCSLQYCCQHSATECFALPFPTIALSPGVTPSPTPIPPTPAPPGPAACGAFGQKCCGSIPPYYCNSGFSPTDPTSLSCTCCECQLVPTGPCDSLHSHRRGEFCCSSPTCPTPTVAPVGIIPWSAGSIYCSDQKSVNTALGCVNVEDTQAFVTWFFRNFLGIAGGIALLMMIYGSIKVIISGGDPEKVNEGKSLITSAVSGLLFMIFSLFLLRFIGVDVLQLPGLTK